MSSSTSFYAQILHDADEMVSVEDAEEEVCDLYSVYYSRDSHDRLDLVDPGKTELEIEIEGGKRSFVVTIGQNPNINGELGQTGAVLWNSSVVMSEYFARKSYSSWNLADLNIVELGSGCGLVGLTLHRLGARRTVLTDQPRMMKLLGRNIDRNRVSAVSKRDKTTEVLATEYVWGALPEDQEVLREPVDMVVASDCVYHESVAPLLVSALVDVCRSRSTSEAGGRTVGVIGQELRSDLVHQAFVAQLLEHFVVRRAPVSESVDRVYALYFVWLRE
ncbi:hypothetical protein LPJ53_005242 [Coemansia erecta]|uniref:Uncharacterized protein n=1 Tax=Coemansia erecta TaxID=147472 RepID=A0A9W8CND2_9FUNG|nr:hypothetical protein LPJ53_005242 [Coemansia erecta]